MNMYVYVRAAQVWKMATLLSQSREAAYFIG